VSYKLFGFSSARANDKSMACQGTQSTAGINVNVHGGDTEGNRLQQLVVRPDDAPNPNQRLIEMCVRDREQLIVVYADLFRHVYSSREEALATARLVFSDERLGIAKQV
jgi:hypothetical protein